MSATPELAPWIALPIAALLVLGGVLVLLGTLGLLRLPSFYQRLHGAAMVSTLGAGSFLIASMLYFSVLQTRPVIHELTITVFVVLTAPVTAILLIRAAVFRDRRAHRPGVPASAAVAGSRGKGGDPTGRMDPVAPDSAAPARQWDASVGGQDDTNG